MRNGRGSRFLVPHFFVSTWINLIDSLEFPPCSPSPPRGSLISMAVIPWQRRGSWLFWPLVSIRVLSTHQDRDDLLERFRERWCVMSFKWDRVHVWSCEVTDQPG